MRELDINNSPGVLIEKVNRKNRNEVNSSIICNLVLDR